MTNPFKVGDLVVENIFHNVDVHKIGVAKVLQVSGQFVYVDKPSQNKHSISTTKWHCSNLRAAIAGQDYDVPTKRTDVYQGHLPDGSSVQAHSAGGLYPFVLVWRDKRNGPDAYGKYDVGVLGPTNQEPIWCPCSDHAIKLAEAIKEYKL